jgi:transposase
VLEARTQVRLYKALVDQRTAWQQRIHAVLFHHGVPAESDLLVAERRQRLTQGAGLTVAAHQAVLLALRMIDAIDAELDLLRAELAHLACRQPGCRALRDLYGVGRSPRSRSGPSSATSAASAPLGTRCATPALT